MVEFVEIQAAYYMVAATGVLIAAIYYILNLRTTIQTRQAQLFMPIYSTYYNDEFIKASQEVTTWNYTDYDDYMKTYSYAANPEAYIQYRKVFGYLEGLGVLVRRKLIDPSLVDDLMSGSVRIADIEAGTAAAANRKREAMNTTLIAIGTRNRALRKQAVAAARRIGAVEIDHGETNCKTPDACEYIARTWKHRAAKKKP